MVTTAVAGVVTAAVPRAVATAVVRTAAPRTAVTGLVVVAAAAVPRAVTMPVAVTMPMPVTSQSNVQVEVILEHSNLLTCEDFSITPGSIEIHCQKSLGNPPIARGGIRIREVRDFQRGESNHRAVESSTAVPTIRTSMEQRH